MPKFVADSVETTGLKWVAPAAPAFVGARAHNGGSAITVANNTFTAITLNSESFDTDAFHSTVTNTSRMTIPSGKNGKYAINATVTFQGNSSNCNVQLALYKNGSSTVLNRNGEQINSGERDFSINTVLDLVATDYLEMFVSQNSGINRAFYATNSQGYFCVTYLGA